MSRSYTRSQIAAALGVSRMQAHRLLPSHSADGFSIGGAGALTWSYDALPLHIRERLKDGEILAAAPPRRFLSSIEVLHLKRWQYLHACTVRSLVSKLLSEALSVNPPLSESKLVEQVVRGVRSGADPMAQHYEAAEGSSPEWQAQINPRHIRTWVRRALRRAGASGQLFKIDLYLCNPYALAQADQRRIRVPHDRPPREMFTVWDVADAVLDKSAPTPEEKAAVWNASFSSASFLWAWFKERVGDEDWARRDARHHVLDAILRSGVALLADRKTLVREWNGYREHWIEHSELHPRLGLPKVLRIGRTLY